MEPWIAPNQLDWILEEVNSDAACFDPDPVTFMEWGSGGSSVWLHERLPSNVKHVVIESDHGWADKVEAAGCPVTRSAIHRSKNDHHLECSCYDVDYICREEVKEANIILVDGFTRGPCMAWAHAHAEPDTTIYLHDCFFWAFQWALHLPRFEIDTVLDSGDRGVNPSPMLRMVVR